MADALFTLNREQVRTLDHRAEMYYAVPPIVLMENAGRGCAELLMRLNPGRRPVVILCGPGNNGGDGLVIARHLDNHGWPRLIFVLAPVGGEQPSRPKLSANAATNFLICGGVGRLRRCRPMPHDDFSFWADIELHGVLERPVLGDAIRSAGWVVDALFGIGLTRPLSEPYDRIVSTVNASGNPVLAIDVPSGLDCDTGEPLGPTIRATHTATFVAPKLGFANPASRAWTGDVHVIDIGAPRKLVDEFRNRVGERPA